MRLTAFGYTNFSLGKYRDEVHFMLSSPAAPSMHQFLRMRRVGRSTAVTVIMRLIRSFGIGLVPSFNAK